MSKSSTLQNDACGLRVLIVEDQPAVAKALQLLLDVEDIPVVFAHTADDALALIDREEIGVVLQDMNFTEGATSGDEGLNLFRRIREIDPKLPVLAVTAWTSLEVAVQMVKEGAADYMAKPWNDDKLITTVKNLLRMRSLALENERLRREKERAREDIASRYDLCGLVYESAAMHRVVSLAGQVAAADVPVLITGPNGSGKEMIAEIIQKNSRRSQGPFIKVNAGALPDELLEAELFGAEQGAYTGATKRRIGHFEAADKGTLFLDEIGNLSPAGQAKLLRVLQSGEFQRVGSSDTKKVDVRVIAATNIDLRSAIAAGRFREDLFFRLNVIEIEIPALVDRSEDILPLAREFLHRFAPQAAEKDLSPDARRLLQDYAWPGNVRELMNCIRRAMLVAPETEIAPEHLGLKQEAVTAEGRGIPGFSTEIGPEAKLEKQRLEKLLRECDGMVSRAATKLGVSRQALYRQMQRLGVTLERRPKS